MVEWIMSNWESIFAIIGVVITAASGIVAALPAAKEGSSFAKFVSLLDKVSIFYAKYKK